MASSRSLSRTRLAAGVGDGRRAVVAVEGVHGRIAVAVDGIQHVAGHVVNRLGRMVVSIGHDVLLLQFIITETRGMSVGVDGLHHAVQGII